MNPPFAFAQWIARDMEEELRREINPDRRYKAGSDRPRVSLLSTISGALSRLTNRMPAAPEVPCEEPCPELVMQ